MKVDILGNSYNVETCGDPAGETVLFIHGFSQNVSTWYPVTEALAAAMMDTGFSPRPVLLDLIGHGGSDRPDDDAPYRLEHIVSVIDGLRELLALDRLHLVGYSMGGRLSLAYAAAHPRRVASLALESASFGPPSTEERARALERDRTLATRLRASSAAEFAEWWAAEPVLASQRSLPEAIRSSEAAMRADADTDALARIVLGAGHGRMDDLVPAAASLSARLLYICGEKDTRYTRLAEQHADAWGLAVRRFPTGHNVHLEQPHAYARALLGFWEPAVRRDEESCR